MLRTSYVNGPHGIFVRPHLEQFLGAVAEVDGLPVLGRLLLPVVGQGIPARDLLLAAALVGGRAHTNLPKGPIEIFIIH